MNMAERQIIAMGGGGFSVEEDNHAMDRYIINRARCKSPSVCFMPPSGEADRYVVRFLHAFSTLECRPCHLSLFRPPTADLESFVLEKDVIYVGGGNTRSMLAVWREWQFDQILRRAWEEGVLLAGLSAGAMCWFHQGLTDSVPGKLLPLDRIGFLSGSCCPWYDGNADRRSTYHRLIAEATMDDGYGIDCGAALHFTGDVPPLVLASRPGPRAYAVSRNDSGIIEQRLDATIVRADGNLT